MTVSRSEYKKSEKLDGVAITGDTLTSRGGLSLLVRYIEGLGVLTLMRGVFGRVRKNGKGRDVGEIFKQLICYFADGTSPHLVWFDSLRKDPGYAAVIESRFEHLLSSHSVKRFFKALSWGLTWGFRDLLQKLFFFCGDFVSRDRR